MCSLLLLGSARLCLNASRCLDKVARWQVSRWRLQLDESCLRLDPMSSSSRQRLEDSIHVRRCLEELLLLSGETKEAPSPLNQLTGTGAHRPGRVESLVRLLRPAAGDMREFTSALKQKIRQRLLERTGGPMLTAKFEK